MVAQTSPAWQDLGHPIYRPELNTSEKLEKTLGLLILFLHLILHGRHPARRAPSLTARIRKAHADGTEKTLRHALCLVWDLVRSEWIAE